MSHHDQTWDPGHGEPDHVHDQNWNRHMMETDDPATWTADDVAHNRREGGKEAVGAGAGALGGAAVGMAVGGPPGAIVGGAVGAAGGAGVGDKAEEDAKGEADYVDPRRV